MASKVTHAAPESSPKMVTLFGSPPNASMFFLTHLSAAICRTFFEGNFSLHLLCLATYLILQTHVSCRGLVVGGEEAEGSDPVVKSNEDNVLFKQVVRSKEVRGASTDDEGASMQVHHYCALFLLKNRRVMNSMRCAGVSLPHLVQLWRVNVQVEAVFVPDSLPV